MIGAIIGDIVGSRFEHHNIKTKEFEFFHRRCRFTDDTVMTVAIAKAILESRVDYSDLADNTIKYMQYYGKKYPEAGYGGRFFDWIFEYNPQPYNSWGNGSAMRVSPCGFAAKSLEEAEALAEITAAVTHNHPQGIKGAKAAAAAIFLAKSGKTKDEIKSYIENNYYRMDFTIDEIRDEYEFDVSCQGSVPQALEAFFESVSFEDAIRNAISIGGDSDTIAAIAGGVAEAYYGIPEDDRAYASDYLDEDLSEVVEEFYNRIK